MSLESTTHSEKKVAIMQPYLFPYLGYFQLVHAADYFVFYDDVAFIRRGWINRNRMLCNGRDQLFTVPVIKSSLESEIKNVSCEITKIWRDKFFKNIEYNYKKCPHFSDVMAIIENVMGLGVQPISELAESSIRSVCQYLGIEKSFLNSSAFSPETKGINRTDRLCTITKKLGLSQYLNLSGGKALYTKEDFANRDVSLFFVESKSVYYDQHSVKEYVPNLSIIDVLMNDSEFEARELISGYNII